MRISIVSGFFLPIPPVSGGATEKSWYNLARQFAARGHRVTFFSRRWPGFPNEETIDGIHHVRLHGFDHQGKLWRNLFLDFIWSWQVFLALPTADIVVVNAIALPAWLGWLKPRAGRVVVMTGRMPKGQYRHYRHIARVLAPSSFVRNQVLVENPSLAPVIRVTGYPIDWQLMNRRRSSEKSGAVVVGFIGRLHEEKGLRLFAEAVKIVGETPGLPTWRVLLCGPADVARGGSGPGFREEIVQKISSAITASRLTVLEPQFNEKALAEIYQSIGVFCYPSLAGQGETFGVAVAEAMAAGAVPVVSRLACFTDFVQHEKNGVVFDHTAADAAIQLAMAIMRLLRDDVLRNALAEAAGRDVQSYDYQRYADALLADFITLVARS